MAPGAGGILLLSTLGLGSSLGPTVDRFRTASRAHARRVFKLSAVDSLIERSESSSVVRSNYLRLVRTSPLAYELQTASLRLGMRDADGAEFTVDLLATVHVGEQDYYASLQRACEEYDRVLFELLVDESSVEAVVDRGGLTVRRLSAPLRASPALRTLATRNGLCAQVDELDCCRPHWVLADVSRRQLAVQQTRLQQPGLATGRNTLAPFAEPLRLLLVGPAAASRSGSGGSALRLLLALLPAPELALLLDDWVSSGGAGLAPVLRPLAAALGRLDLPAARRLSFAQTLAAGETTQDGQLSGSLVRWRNAQALEEVASARAAGCESIALLYGALHMRDLRARLLQRYELVSMGTIQWRAVWSVHAPAQGEEAVPERGRTRHPSHVEGWRGLHAPPHMRGLHAPPYSARRPYRPAPSPEAPSPLSVSTSPPSLRC